MTKTTTTWNNAEYPSKKVTVENHKSALLEWFPPIIQDLYQREEHNRHLLDPILTQLQQVLAQFQLGIGEGECPNCSTNATSQPLTLYRIEEKPILTIGNVTIVVKIKNYRCPRCIYRQEERAELTLLNGYYDRGLVLIAAAIHTCGCSLEDTRGLLTSIFGITPTTSTIHNWKIKIGLQAHHLNSESLSLLKVKGIQIDELFTAVRDGRTEGAHTPVFATAIIESTYGAFLTIGISQGSQTNRVIVEANLQKIVHHEPLLVTGDGCPSYPGAVAQELPDATFVRDLVHEVRGVRKKKSVKQLLKRIIEDYQGELTGHWRQSLQKDRQQFLKQLLDDHRGQPKTKETRAIARTDWKAYRRLETLEAEAYAQNTQEQVTLFKHCVHRRLYLARETARIACWQTEDTKSLTQSFTTCRLEGTFRIVRSRERRGLCHRSVLGFNALLGLLLLYHNMVGTGRGCLYELLGVSAPDPRWNPFIRFPARKKSQTTLSPPLSTPFRSVITRFRQQHSHQLNHPPFTECLELPCDNANFSLEVSPVV